MWVDIFRAGVLGCVALLCSGAAAAATYPAVQPGEDFSNPTLQVHAPTSEGWHLMRSANRIAFAKSGSDRDESYVAAVILFRLPELTDSAAFTEYAKKGIAEDSPPDRFAILEAKTDFSSQRGYPCVKYESVSIDKARVSRISRKPLRLEMIALYCQHPNRPNLGFMASYSHRGGAVDDLFAGDAEKFIASVQVPPQAPTTKGPAPEAPAREVHPSPEGKP
jgi:hypothetical protein